VAASPRTSNQQEAVEAYDEEDNLLLGDKRQSTGIVMMNLKIALM
jgi:hypothetical protein